MSDALFDLEEPASDAEPRFPNASAGTAARGYAGIPTPYRTTPELCPAFFHPPVTYNERMDRTWCLCGRKTYPGDATSTPHLACCDGALTELLREKAAV